MLETEIAVIGGGVIGTSIAYYLAKEGKKVALLERDHLASETSGACDGNIFLQTKRPGIGLDLAMKSARMFEGLEEELGYRIEYKKNGGMVIIEEEGQFEVMEKFVQAQRQSGLDVEILGNEAARKVEPALAEHIAGATWSRSDGNVNPMFLTFAFGLAAKRLGAKICTGAEVISIKTESGRIRSIVTKQSEVKTKVVINAAGSYAPLIGAMVGVNIPIKPRRGQLVVTEPCPKFITSALSDAKYVLVKLAPHLVKSGDDDASRLGVGLALEQTATGNVIIGGTREFVGYDKRTTIEGVTAMVRHTSRMMPRLRQLCVIRAFSGLRPYTPDGLPIIDSLDNPEGFVIAAGHEGDGIALAPMTGKIVAKLVTEGKLSSEMKAFALSRFEKDTA
ncbi:FAD-binding oxidoreductase [Candidatus Bathyarchaeota archaeon]|nr:FAD-binding oxidoreductase [Candidatus Bathyarchaeota archaeon]